MFSSVLTFPILRGNCYKKNNKKYSSITFRKSGRYPLRNFSNFIPLLEARGPFFFFGGGGVKILKNFEKIKKRIKKKNIYY